MKILHICSYYLGTKLYQNLFNALEKSNIKEDIYVFTDKQHKIGSEYPLNVHISRCYNKIDRYIFHLKHLKVLKDIQKRMDIKEYRIMHAHSLFSNGYIAYKLNKKYGIPYIVAVRNTDINLFFDKISYLRNTGLSILRNATRVIFISGPYKEHVIDKIVPEKYKREVRNKSVVIPNGIDEFWLMNKYKDSIRPKGNRVKLIFAGRIDINKNIETTTKACELLIKQGYDVSYKIIGKIADSKYNGFIKKYPFIEYVNHCKKEELINHYRDSDIFIMPSKHETFGRAYAEAMSQGLPVIYTRGQGFDGQFNEGEVGYSVKYDLAEEIVEKIKDIIDNYENISRNCVEKVDRFDWNKIARSYAGVYKKNYEDCTKNYNTLQI